MKKNELLSNIHLLLQNDEDIIASAIVGSASDKMKDESSEYISNCKDIDIIVVYKEGDDISHALLNLLAKHSQAKEVIETEDGVNFKINEQLFHVTSYYMDIIQNMLAPLLTFQRLQTLIPILAPKQRPWTCIGWQLERFAYDIASAFITTDTTKQLRALQDQVTSSWENIVTSTTSYNAFIIAQRVKYLMQNERKISINNLLCTITDISTSVYRILFINSIKDFVTDKHILFNQQINHNDQLKPVYQQYLDLPRLIHLFESDFEQYLKQINSISSNLLPYNQLITQ